MQVFANLIMVSVIDPGIIPRNDESPSPESTQNGRVRSKRVFVNGLELKLKYCRICNIYRPARSCHCIVCDNCVDKFDHHCPWIGQCIGLVCTIFWIYDRRSINKYFASNNFVLFIPIYAEELSILCVAIGYCKCLLLLHIWFLMPKDSTKEWWQWQWFDWFGARLPGDIGVGML